MIYPVDFEKKIGFDTIRTILSDKCRGRLGKEFVSSMEFMTDISMIRHSLGCVDEMRRIITSGIEYPVPASHDVTPYLREISAHSSFMSADRLYKLMQMLVSFSEVRRFFTSHNNDDGDALRFPELEKEVENLGVFPELVSTIGNVVDKFGEVKDNASPELYEIREQMRRAQGSMQRAMRRVLDSAMQQGIVDKDASPAIRDGHLVIPVAAGKKRELSGIIHDESATGKTVFVEPAEVVEAGNKLRKLELDEKREIVVILMRVADSIRPHIEDIINSCRLLGYLDFIEAKARFAFDTDASMPHIEDKRELEWYHAVHPGLLLSLRKQGRETVPLDLTLSDDTRILIISGPNAGGKSVCLKTIAIVQYMMQCGVMPTLYNNSHMGIFKRLFIDIGDEQSLENDLSTYSSHLRNMKFFLRNADKRTLFLADEMGSGTEPQIGGAMAQAILDKLGKSGAMGVVTTHYQNLKSFAETTPGFVNGAMLYDRQHLAPTFRLSVGMPGSSFALDIAHKMGLPADVIDEAKEIVGSDYVNLDKYVADIMRDRRYWQNKRQNIREKESKLDNLLSKYEEVAGDLKTQRREIIADARREANEILSEANARIERTILEIRNAQAEKERTKALRKELREFTEANREADTDRETTVDKNLKKMQPRKKRDKKPVETPAPQPVKKVLEVGDFVKLEGSNTVGEIISISGKKGVVAFGGLRTIVELSKLTATSKPKKQALETTFSSDASTYNESRARQLNFKNEIDVRGMRADEALQAVTYFIDDAIQFSASRVRILHGTGHGILKTLIRQQLKTNGAVRSFEDEDIRFGGAGITVVDLE